MELLASDDSGAVVLYECMECGFQSEERVENVLEEPLDGEDAAVGDPDADDEPFPEDGEDAYVDPDEEDYLDEEDEDWQ
ncbi:MAG: hypothetical protein QN163_02120 [Armatimonadota bacterium]|nr:hypothetical protein [Armatimonadota bacterium]MDR5696278.1 hypothetical protein [Armatimonadota bacterium]